MAIPMIVLAVLLTSMIAACSSMPHQSLVDGGYAFQDTTYGAKDSLTTPNGPM